MEEMEEMDGWVKGGSTMRSGRMVDIIVFGSTKLQLLLLKILNLNLFLPEESFMLKDKLLASQFSRLPRLLQHHEWCQSGGGLGGSSYFHRDPRNLHPRSRWDAGFNWSIFPSGGCDGGMGPWLHWSLLAGEESSKPLLARPYVGMLRPCQPCVGIVRKQQPWENYTKIVKVWVVSQIIICVGCTYSSVDCFRPVPTCNMKSPLFLLESSHIELSKSWSGAALSWLICWLQL